jgi:hypothetical protein
MNARRLLLGWVLFALVCAQSLGFMHRVAHGAGASWGAAEAHAGTARDAASPSATGWIDGLFAHDTTGLGCKLFDGLGQCGVAPHAAPLAVPLAAVAFTLPFANAPPVQARPTPFEARAPPVSR